MRRLLIPALLAAATACAPGSAAVRSFPVAGFDRVESKGSFDVHVHTGAAFSAHATGDQEMLDRLLLEVRNGTLVVTTKPNSGWHWGWGSHKLLVEVSAPMVRGLALTGSGGLNVDVVKGHDFEARLSGSGDIRIGAVQVERLALSLGGSGDILAAGRVGHSALELRGSGNIKAGDVTALDTVATLAGSGDIVTTATRNATANLLGVGDITIHGGAHCQIVKHGVGDVHCS